VTGRASYDGLVLFKMALLQTWYGLSDYEVEDRVNDSISFSNLTEKGAYEKIFKALNKQLDKHKILVKTGAIIDASIIDSPLKPKGTVTYEIENDRAEEERSDQQKELETKEQTLLKVEKTGVDTDARFKKTGKLRYGYKKHYVTDQEGLVLGVLTTAANVNEISNLEEVLDTADLPKGIHLNGDKGYDTEIKREKLRNKLIGFKVERTFSLLMPDTKGLQKLLRISWKQLQFVSVIASNSFKMVKM
jgi:transposase, IS5 family